MKHTATYHKSHLYAVLREYVCVRCHYIHPTLMHLHEDINHMRSSV